MQSLFRPRSQTKDRKSAVVSYQVNPGGKRRPPIALQPDGFAFFFVGWSPCLRVTRAVALGNKGFVQRCHFVPKLVKAFRSGLLPPLHAFCSADKSPAPQKAPPKSKAKAKKHPARPPQKKMKYPSESLLTFLNAKPF